MRGKGTIAMKKVFVAVTLAAAAALSSISGASAGSIIFADDPMSLNGAKGGARGAFRVGEFVFDPAANDDLFGHSRACGGRIGAFDCPPVVFADEGAPARLEIFFTGEAASFDRFLISGAEAPVLFSTYGERGLKFRGRLTLREIAGLAAARDEAFFGLRRISIEGFDGELTVEEVSLLETPLPGAAGLLLAGLAGLGAAVGFRKRWNRA